MQPRDISAERRSGRARHVAAKATDCARENRRRAGHSRGREDGTQRQSGPEQERPSPAATSGEGGPYKPKAKGGRAGRESEGLVVPLKSGRTGRAEGRGPGFVASATGGKCEGMAARPNNPSDKARQLQRRLYMAAKRSRGRRFHALYDRIRRGDVLAEAWRRVQANGGAAGVDGESVSAIERQGVAPFLEAVARCLRDGRYRPQPVRRRYIPKGDGSQRPLGIPAVRDRVVQAAAKLVLEPIFEADFRECSYGFRPRRGATGALETIRLHGGRGHRFVVDGDIRQFFDRLDRKRLMELLRRRISDRRVLKLLRQWLEAGVMEDGTVRETLAGTPQGGVISPLLANIYLHVLDETWERECRHLGLLVRYADDFVVLCRTRAQADEALRRVREILTGMGLELHPEKTRVVELGLGRDGFVFLGCYLRVVRSHFKGRTYLFRWPSPKAMNRVRARIRELTDRQRRAGMKDIREVVRDLNPVLRGWGNYFRTGNASLKFRQMDRYVTERLVRLVDRGHRARQRAFVNRTWPAARFVKEFGLHQLAGTIRYPGGAHAA